jgi:hypothetical protein
MPSLTPLETALAIVAVLAAVGLVLYYFRDASRYSGFEEISADVRQISRALGGEVFRDGADLVISGNYGRLPAVIRFSYLENTPGMNIQVKAPATFALSCTPRNADVPGAEGRVPIKLSDTNFDARFITRTDFPTQARMFLGGGPRLVKAVTKLCCSAKTYFTISPGSMELSELVIPSPYTGSHVLQHLESMKLLAAELRQMPGADRVKVQRITRDKYAVARAAIVVGVIVAVGAVVAANRDTTASAPTQMEADPLPAGLYPVDAAYIRNLQGWRLATEADLDPNVRGWLRGQRIAFEGRMEARFSPDGRPDVAYVLRNESGAWRVILLVDGQNRYDATWESLAGVAIFSRFSLPNLQWTGPPPEGVENDGMLLIRSAEDPASGLVVFPAGNRIISAAPANYQSIRLQ